MEWSVCTMILCAGNVQQLCVQEKTDPESTLQFILCQQRDIRRIGSYTLFAECLQSTSPKWLSVMRCALGEEGKHLLQTSVAESRHNNMKVSLTFALNGQKRCVFDSGHWVKPEDGCPGGNTVPDFTHTIKEL
ncbi:hypothetical protein GGH94_005131 [Coemansia aciculifera]|uniref:Uncharacterized protein n=1 Tax=Coemansia aciculifera TaxID=417176 RepID=A0A9W8IKL5_9FUNG|nr:hypothetical protein GGH94_005131 [Coemansia aciculifera]